MTFGPALLYRRKVALVLALKIFYIKVAGEQYVVVYLLAHAQLVILLM